MNKEKVFEFFTLLMLVLILGILIGMSMVKVGRTVTSDGESSHIISCYEEYR